MSRSAKIITSAAVLLMAVMFIISARAQFFGGGGGRWSRSGDIRNPELIREKEEMEKAIDPAFGQDVFALPGCALARTPGYRYGGGRIWDDDTPEAT